LNALTQQENHQTRLNFVDDYGLISRRRNLE